jgi:hypothetical protein
VPGQKILLMSGYHEAAEDWQGEDEASRYPQLQKPFKMSALLAAVQGLVP